MPSSARNAWPWRALPPRQRIALGALLTLFMAPDAAEAYNGQQGDMWHAHKDMALALAGSLVAGLWVGRRDA